MDYAQILAQQQQVAQQAIQNAQAFIYMAMAIQLVLFMLGCWVVYMFYARLRDIGDELQKFRIAYEFANAPERRSAGHQEQRSTTPWPEEPRPVTPSGEDDTYKPKAQ
jgi:hypothetical protein